MLDRRLNAFRTDLAEKRLEGQVEALRFVEGRPARLIASTTAMRPQPSTTSGMDTELLFGEPVSVLDRANGWAWVKSGVDDYVGYVEETALGGPGAEPTHWVTAPRTFVYSEPDMKRPTATALSMGSRITVTGEAETRGTRYLLVDGGAVIAKHVAEVDMPISDDYVSVATRFLASPYLWGGRSGFGLDCSGLVQLSMMMTGKAVLRDTDMQRASIGTEIGRNELKRGDLVFWKGHVAIMVDAGMMIHSSGFTMDVSHESLADAIKRIEPMYGLPLLCRRPS
ncbi:C40 family peptidase [Rhizobium sp. TH2]|uniref:C40 family peptidase n=1 Tax=Rhizobium sp. TH2 TaxID=2775403 RepID=UPI00215811B6|nr:NlpC/P60 family protein [Rhizobium sp. TH2]UVC08719.1 C40 family peptidase [Rhizobium sp. TH2]